MSFIPKSGTSATDADIDSAIAALDLNTASQHPTSDFATAAEGTKADTAVQPSGLSIYETITQSGLDITAGVNAEAALRLAATNALTTQFTTVSTNLSTETTNRTNADSAEVTARNSAITSALTPYETQTKAGTDISTAITALSLKSASQHLATDFATSTQGSEADTAIQPAGLTSALTSYETISALGVTLGGYETTSALTTALTSYETRTQSGTDIAAEATLRTNADSAEVTARNTAIAAAVLPKPDVWFSSTKKTAPIFYAGSATVGAITTGAAVFYLTVDGTSTGTALMATPNLSTLNYYVNDATSSYQVSAALSNTNKTLTLTTNKLTTANILTGLLGQAAATGASVAVTIWGQ